MTIRNTTFLRRYEFRLYPNAEQAIILHEHRKLMADLWNACKQRIEDVYRREQRMLSYYDLTNEITGLRHECPEWEQIPSVTAHRVAKWLIDAYKAFFRRCKSGEAPGYPKWRKRECGKTIPLGTMDKTGWTFSQRLDNPLSWTLYYKGLSRKALVRRKTPRPAGPSEIHARGTLPCDVEEWRNADILWRDGKWWLSICTKMLPRREPGRQSVTITMDLFDGFTKEFGTPETLLKLEEMDQEIDLLKSERDRRFPRNQHRNEQQHQELQDLNAEIAAKHAYVARMRRNCLHVWTARMVRHASDLTVKMPRISEQMSSPHGNEKNWGACTKEVSAINRHALSYAPAMAAQMLQYKAEEAGIRCDIVDDPAPKVGAGADLMTAGKAVRRSRRRKGRHDHDNTAKTTDPVREDGRLSS